jgi:tetratricopeptide (TPR) repeat protein
LLRKGTPESYARAKVLLEQTIALDPKFALAHAELASCFRLLASLGDTPTREALLQARAAAVRALDFDSTLPQARAHLAELVLFLDYDWVTAGRHFALAMAHQPVPSEVSHLYGFFYLMPLGRMQDAILEMERSLKDDPLNLECLSQYASLLWAVGRNEEALRCFHQALELDENFWLTLFLLGLWHSHVGSVEAGLAAAERAYAVMPRNLNSAGLLAGLFWRTGNFSKAEEMLESLGDTTAFGAPLAWSVYYDACLDFKKAADWVEKAIEQHDPNALPAACGCYRREYVVRGRWPGMARMLRLPEPAVAELQCDILE